METTGMKKSSTTDMKKRFPDLPCHTELAIPLEATDNQENALFIQVDAYHGDFKLYLFAFNSTHLHQHFGAGSTFTGYNGVKDINHGKLLIFTIFEVTTF